MFFLKTLLGIFKIALHLRDRHFFKRQSLEILTVFYTLTSNRIFWIMKTFFNKLEDCFLVESIMTENASFSYKTAMSETNVNTNRMESTKWTYHKERSFVGNNFIF